MIHPKRINSFLEGLTKIADLIYFDGPLLSLFRDHAGRKYFYYWCDVEQFYNRWLVFPVSQPTLEQYLNKDITLREIILEAIDEGVYIVDIDDSLQYQNISQIRLNEIPHSYLPANDSFYDFQPIFYEEQKVPIKDFYAVFV